MKMMMSLYYYQGNDSGDLWQEDKAERKLKQTAV